jgi:hypothetical protein
MTLHGRRWIGALVGLAATASLAVAVVAYIQRLPDPNTADRRGLFRWLVDCDLGQESLDIQLTLLRRVERELAGGVDFRDVLPMLEPAQRQRLQANADLLARCWFAQAADTYFAAPESERSTVLGQQLDHVRRLGIVEQLSALDQWSQQHPPSEGNRPAAKSIATESSPKESTGANHWLATMTAQAARVQRWIDEATPVVQRRLSQYFAALRTRMLVEYFRDFGGLGSLLPSG